MSGQLADAHSTNVGLEKSKASLQKSRIRIAAEENQKILNALCQQKAILKFICQQKLSLKSAAAETGRNIEAVIAKS